MYRIVNFGAVLFLIWGHALRAASPEDIAFRARLVKGTHAYYMDEPIEIELSYSSQIEKKYYGSFSRGVDPRFDSVTPQVTPSAGFFDMRGLKREEGDIFIGVVGPTDVGSKPVTQRFDLSKWYRFQKPGHYSVTVTSRDVWRVKRKEEGGGHEDLTLESNPVDLDILPADPVRIAGELGTIEQGLSTSRDNDERQLLADRLARIDTPASVQMGVQLYLASTDNTGQSMFYWGLRESSQIDVIIPLLETALSDPVTINLEGLTELLADLQRRQELGVMPDPNDPARQQKYTEEMQARSKVRDKYVAQANERLMASIERRSGRQRVEAIYQVWYEAAELNADLSLNPAWHAKDLLAPGELSRLQSDVLAVANDLSPDQQERFVTIAWPTMRHEQLLPLIRKLATTRDPRPAWPHNNGAFRLWCEGWPEECDAAIVRDVLESNTNVDKEVILLLPEAEHRELDKLLETKLKDPAILHDPLQSQRTAVVILRAGSRNIASAVDSFLDRTRRWCDGEHGGEAWGDLIGYLFRVSPERGAKRLSEALQAKDRYCGGGVLGTLGSVRPSEDLIPIVTKALDSPNLSVAESAALYLGAHGPASTEDALWRRLEALWSVWRDRSSELSNPLTGGFGAGTKGETANLEKGLAAALSQAKNWKLSPEELDRLQSGCLTQQCRDMSDGRHGTMIH